MLPRPVVASLLLLLLAAALGLPPPPRSGDPVPHEWVITFGSYHQPGEHSSLIQRLAHGHSAGRVRWHVKPRDNPAAALASDFALLVLEGDAAAQQRFVAWLRAREGVKRVEPHRVIIAPTQQTNSSSAASRTLCANTQLVDAIGSPQVWAKGFKV